MRILHSLILAALATGCAAPLTQGSVTDAENAPTLVQGFIGATDIDDDDAVDLDVSGVDVEDAGVETMPLIGAAWQIPLRGERVHLGFEAGFTFGWEGDRGSASFNNTTVVKFDNDVILADLFVGLSLSTHLSERVRLYGGVGPLLQFVDVDLDFDDNDDDLDQLDDNGFGGGAYGRLGIEVKVNDDTYVGLSVRRVESTVEFDDELDDFDVEANQVMLTVTTSW